MERDVGAGGGAGPAREDRDDLAFKAGLFKTNVVRQGVKPVDEKHPAGVGGHLAQLAVGDLDDDGLPEIVSSAPSLERKADQLVVRTLSDNGQLRERLRVP